MKGVNKTYYFKITKMKEQYLHRLETRPNGVYLVEAFIMPFIPAEFCGIALLANLLCMNEWMCKQTKNVGNSISLKIFIEHSGSF